MTSPLPPGPGSNPPAAHTLQLPGRGPGQTPSPSGSPPPDTTKLVIAGLIAALLSVVAVQAYIFQIKRGATEDEFTFFRMRVTREPGQTLTLDDVKLERVPDRLESSFPDVIRPNEAGEPLRLGDTFTRRAEQNVPLTARLFDDLEGDPARQLVKSGYRGVALPVVARSLPDPLKAEMRVDIMAPVRMSAASHAKRQPQRKRRRHRRASLFARDGKRAGHQRGVTLNHRRAKQTCPWPRQLRNTHH